MPPTYVGRDHVQRQTEIGWPSIPNEGMKPSNEAAREVFALFIRSIGGPTPKAEAAQRDNGTLKVMHEADRKEVSPVGKPRGGNLHIIGRDIPGEVVETRVLGSIASPARQLA